MAKRGGRRDGERFRLGPEPLDLGPQRRLALVLTVVALVIVVVALVVAL